MDQAIDLHTHSQASDGSDPPAALVRQARRAGLSAVALTDHDTLDGLQAALAAAGDGLELVPGVELSVSRPGEGLTRHLVCLWPGGTDGPVGTELAWLQQARRERNAEMLRRLAALGMPLAAEQVAALAGGQVIGRPHMALALIEKGYVGSPGEAFDRFLARGRPAYVDRHRLTPEAAIEMVHRAGGVAVLAHPGLLPLDAAGLEADLRQLADAGLDGLEVRYPTHPPELEERLQLLAKRLGLAPSGGSDYHGAAKPNQPLGVPPVPREWLEALRARQRPTPASRATPSCARVESGPAEAGGDK